ncbi:hypothetical protein JAK72_11285 [Stenotrophomonas maltophilia]|uniref:hypothetical protein n=1 Tax=Stenotrophomonas maltophilia TaxID=40324 RepID=UPI0021C6232F|nr:hypothetical protein [Stenotrophomonas maltophilia]MCU1038764.1 hypothetical protein [Stenotrophomonas maltophilia]
MTTPLPVSPATVVEATKASSPVAAVVTTMRRLGAAGAPISADQVREWSDTLLQELYSQPPVRWEYRNKNDVGPGCWVTATPEHFYHAPKRGWVVRALWETPRVIQPERDHAFKAGVCTRCGDPEDWAGPDCMPLPAPVDPRAKLPFDPRWLLQPLRWLRDAGPGALNRYDREHRAKQAAFLIEQLEAQYPECRKP